MLGAESCSSSARATSNGPMEQGGVDSIHAFAAGRAGNEGACICSTVLRVVT